MSFRRRDGTGIVQLRNVKRLFKTVSERRCNVSFRHKEEISDTKVAEDFFPGWGTEAQRPVRVRRRTRANFMRVLPNEICLSCVCAEGTTPFSAVAQRLKIGG